VLLLLDIALSNTNIKSTNILY